MRDLVDIDKGDLHTVTDLKNQSKKLPRFIRYLRERNERTQSEIADILNIKQPSYNRRESGTLDFSIREIEILAQIYFEEGIFGFWTELQKFNPNSVTL